MASSGNNIKTVVVDLKLMPNDTVKTIQDLQTKIANLKQVMEGMRAQGMQNTETYIKLQATLKELEQGVRANQKVLRDSIRENQKNSDSLNSMRAQLRNLRAEYENLSKAERESAKGQDMLNHIHDLTQEIKGLEEAQLDFTRNVGNYKSALEGLPFGKVIAGFNQLSQGTGKLSVAFKNGKTVVASFGKQLWALVSNPFVAAIAAIVAVFAKLVNEIKKNDDALTAMQRVMAALKPILDIINKGFLVLVNVVAKAANAVAGFVGKIMSFIPRVKDYVAAEQELVNATDDLEEAEREYTVNSAKRQSEISELRNKAAQSDKYTYAERKKFLEDALQLEQDELKEKQDIAQQKLDIAREEAAHEIGFAHYTKEAYNNMNDEAKNKLAELEAAVINATTEFNNGTRRMQSSLAAFTKQEENEQKQRAASAASARKERLKNEREAVDALQKMWINGIRDLQDKEYALTAQEGKKQIDQLKNRLKEGKNLTKTAREAINRQIILMEADLQLKLGDLREKYQQDELEKQLNDTKNYYQHVLAGLKDENVDAKVAVKLELNRIDTKLLKKSLKEGYEQVKKVTESTKKELEDLELGNISVDDITAKYKDVWELNGINLGNALANMKALVKKYEDDELYARTQYQNTVLAIDRETEQEELRIKAEGTKQLHDEEVRRLDLSRKHAEILRQIELANNFDEYGKNELEKTRIMLEQARERERIAKEEYARIAGEREKYTDEELTAIYGSVEEYNNLVLDANLKLIESENGVKQAVKDVADASKAQRQVMIGTAINVMSAFNQVAGSFSELFTTLSENDAKYQEYANALALVDIMTNMAVGIATAVAEGMKMGWPAAAIMIPVGIATVVSGIASAIALFKKNDKVGSAPKYAEGGLIGNKTTRRKDDTVTAKLTLGEYVIPAPVVDDLGTDFFDQIIGKKGKKLPKIGNFETPHFATGGLVQSISTPNLNIAETSINYDIMKDVMVEAMGEIQPVVSVREITHAQQRVSVKERIARQ